MFKSEEIKIETTIEGLVAFRIVPEQPGLPAIRLDCYSDRYAAYWSGATSIADFLKLADSAYFYAEKEASEYGIKGEDNPNLKCVVDDAKDPEQIIHFPLTESPLSSSAYQNASFVGIDTPYLYICSDTDYEAQESETGVVSHMPLSDTLSSIYFSTCKITPSDAGINDSGLLGYANRQKAQDAIVEDMYESSRTLIEAFSGIFSDRHISVSGTLQEALNELF